MVVLDSHKWGDKSTMNKKELSRLLKVEHFETETCAVLVGQGYLQHIEIAEKMVFHCGVTSIQYHKACT